MSDTASFSGCRSSTTVSRRVSYSWTCSKCHDFQRGVVWEIVDARERPEVLASGLSAPGFVRVACANCGTSHSIADRTILVIRPEATLPMLLAIPKEQMSDDYPPGTGDLLNDALTAMSGEPLGVYPPLIVIPRHLLAVILTRTPDDDVRTPDAACIQVAEAWSVGHAEAYRLFLLDVEGSARTREINRLLQQVWSTPPDLLEQFVEGHPDLASPDVVATVANELNASLPQEEVASPLAARLKLLQSLAAGASPAGSTDEYKRAIGNLFAQHVAPRIAELIAALSEDPSPSLIPDAQELLTLAVRIGDPTLEAFASCDLGNRYLRVPSSRGMEEATALLARTLELIGDDDPYWAVVAGNLAQALVRRPSGDPNANWARAHDLLTRACQADPESDVHTWVVNHTNLGLLLSERPGGSDVNDLTEAIGLIKAGAARRSPDEDLTDWAYAQVNLGFLYRRRSRPGDDAVATSLFQGAAARLDPAVDRRLWASLQLNIGELLAADAAPGRDQDILNAARDGLEAEPPLEDPELKARLIWLTARHTAVPAGALELRRQALNLLAPDIYSSLYLRIGAEVAKATELAGDWNVAASTYERMLLALDALLEAQSTEQGRRRTLEEWPRLSRWAAYALARADRPEQAVQAIEQGRARELAMSTSRTTAQLADLRRIDANLANRYEYSRRAYAAAVIQAGRLQEAAAAQALVEAAADLRDAVETIRTVPGHARFQAPLSTPELLRATGGLPVAYLVPAALGSCVLTLENGADGETARTAVQFSGVNAVDVASVAVFDFDRDRPGLLTAQDKEQRQAALARLAELTAFTEPVVALFQSVGVEKVVIVPTGPFSAIPIHAIPTSNGRVLDDEGETHIAPSVAVYEASRRRSSRVAAGHLVGVADTDELHPLRASRQELAFVERLFAKFERPSIRLGDLATRQWVLDEARVATHLHFACHGSSSLAARFGCELVLADGVLDMTDLTEEQFGQCRLAVASACESGHHDIALTPDEFLGLPAGFLRGGAACVVASLWKVDDVATAFLMIRFYELLGADRAGPLQTPVAALRAARLWMKTLTPANVGEYRRTHATSLGSPNPRLDESLAERLTSVNSWASFAAYGC